MLFKYGYNCTQHQILSPGRYLSCCTWSYIWRATEIVDMRWIEKFKPRLLSPPLHSWSVMVWSERGCQIVRFRKFQKCLRTHLWVEEVYFTIRRVSWMWDSYDFSDWVLRATHTYVVRTCIIAMVTHASLCEYTIVLFPSTNMSQKSSSFIICLLDEYIPATALCSYDMFRVCYGLIFRFLFFNILSLTFNLCVCLQHTDMPEEMRVETMELCVTACEKFATNNEVSERFVWSEIVFPATLCLQLMAFARKLNHTLSAVLCLDFLLFVRTARLHSLPLHIKIFPFCPRRLSQSAAKMIKESMDKKFGSSWHVVIGEGFGFEVTHEVKNLLYMFFGGSLAVCVWKCS